MRQIMKLILGVALGTCVGYFLPEFFVRTLVTLHTIIGELIGFTIPLLILFFVGEGIASLPNNSRKLLGQTVGTAYLSTIFAGMVAYFAAANLLPELIVIQDVFQSVSEKTIEPFMQLEITPLCDVMTALALAFVFGLGVSHLQQKTLKSALVEGREIIDTLLAKLIIPSLPVYIAGVFAKVAFEGTVFAISKTFFIVFAMIIVLHWTYIFSAYAIAGTISQTSPLTMIRTMLPAYFTALGTMSSAATIPVTLRQVKNLSVRDGIANFTVPLCASIHLSGSVMTLVTCSVAVMLVSPDIQLMGPLGMLGFILTLGVAMVAAPGAPGGGVMSAVGLLASVLGFHEAGIALMIALYLAQDSFGTACNVIGDGALSTLIHKLDEREVDKALAQANTKTML